MARKKYKRKEGRKKREREGVRKGERETLNFLLLTITMHQASLFHNKYRS